MPVVPDPSSLSTFLFTDIEGSTRLWEQEPERMRQALARHDAVIRAAVGAHRGVVVKMTGDGVHAVFDDPLDAINATLELQHAIGNPHDTNGITLQVRCGVHAGAVERRDNDFYGSAVNRGARIMNAAHGGQVLVSQAVATLVEGRLPAGIALRDLGSVRLRDLAHPERLYQVIAPDMRREFPALRSLEATPNNLSHQLTPFVGRERELGEIKSLIRETRLVTLHGVGGLGKTRTSLQVAADVIDEYPDGVWFVELAPLTDARLVPQAVASVLAVKEEAGRPVAEALVKFVKDRRLLLILDNCEHLTLACAELARQLLQAGPYVKILASSRENLRVAGEALYPLPPLAAPEPQASSAAALRRYEAVRLFVDRATAAQPPFRLTDENATAVAQICRSLDGIPLALELAAARVRAMSVDNIAARLNDRFRLLRAGDQTALPRQQTLRALIDWSYDLLEEPERIMFRRLGVFVGGWTLAAVEAVCAGGELNSADIVDLLTRLVEKSLVALDPLTGRYRLLETVRQYAQERLASADDEPLARNQHLAYFVELAEKARAALFGPEQGTWLARLDLEGENLLAAHAWCNQGENGAELGLRLVNAVKQYWVYRGYLALGYAITIEALGRAGAQKRDALRSRAQFCAGQLCSLMGRHEEAQQRLEESLAIAKEIDDRNRIAAVLQPLVWATLGRGDIATARGYSNQALTLAREVGSKRDVAAAINLQAQIHRLEGDIAAAEPLYVEVLSLGRELGDRNTIAIGLLNLAMVAIVRGSIDRAAQMLLDVIAIAEEIGSKSAGQSVLEVSAGLASLRQDWQRAARFYGAAEAHMDYTGIVRDPADDAFLTPLIVKGREAFGEASFAAAEATGRTLSYEQAMDEVRTWLESSR
jgi:predicted ATPase/class 3 adenylate cyclase